MEVFLLTLFVYFFAAVAAYLIGGVNPSIIVSKTIYKKDVRELGSHNAGFTNFKRAFGGKWAWLVLIGDGTMDSIQMTEVVDLLVSSYLQDTLKHLEFHTIQKLIHG